jgi:type I restriction enzyme S subunit
MSFEPSAWPEVSLEEIAKSFRYGVTASASDDPSEGPKFVRITDILTGQVAWSAVPYCDAGDVDRDKFGLRRGDIVIARIGASAGTAARVERDTGAVFASYLVRVRLNGCLADSQFVGCVLQSPQWLRHVRDTQGGSAQPQFNAPLMKAFRFALPPLDTQRRIAAVLRALDDRIESNARLATLLHDEVGLQFSQFIRSGAPATLGELGIVRGGGTPKSSEPSYWNPAEVPWVTPKDMTKLAGSPVVWRGERFISKAGLDRSSAKLVPAGTVLYTSRATLGLIAIAQQSLSTNQGFIMVEPAAGYSSEFIYFTLREARERIAAKAGGSTFPEVNKSNFKAVACTIPRAPELKAFDVVARPTFELIAGLARENGRLQSIRDELLPGLVSGSLRMPEYQEDQEGVAA